MNTAAEAIRALSMQMPGFRLQMNEGWYQIRIAGEDTAPEVVYARLHEQLGEGTVIHIVPRLAGAGKGGLQIVLGAAAIVGSFFTAGASMALWGSALAAGGFSATTMLFSLGASMILGGVAQMLAPKAKTPDYRATDNGRQNTYFSSLDNMIAQGNPMPVRVTFGVQSLVQTTSKGDRNPSSVRILIQLQRNGRWVTEKDVTINGKTTSQFLASVILDNLPPRPFNIRMVRETADSTTDQLQNRTLWSSYTEIIDVKQCYPNTAIVGMQVDAEQFGGQQMTVNYHIDMPAGHGHMTLEFSVSAWLMNNWYPTASISDLLVVVMKKATAGISIS